MSAETRETRLKRLYMRSIRRGIKEMDVILQKFAGSHLGDLGDDDLDLYELLLEEPDQDLYLWVSGQAHAPARFKPMIDRIAEDIGAPG